ncbi:helix-turn-helix domain-containing protein [Larkinella bovis]|uniref:Helix-turn-helix domain-containing protein n=1 Tax=Larkinella bovis TaxID=683041 RepID=A0ABW0IL19_9BACT
MTTKGTYPVRAVKRAQALLAFATRLSGYVVAQKTALSVPTGYQIRTRYQQAGLRAAVGEKAKPGRRLVFDGVACAKLKALACSQAPVGHNRWTLRLLADKAVELALVDHIGYDSVARILKKTSYNRIGGNNGVSELCIANTWPGWRTYWHFTSSLIILSTR